MFKLCDLTKIRISVEIKFTFPFNNIVFIIIIIWKVLVQLTWHKIACRRFSFSCICFGNTPEGKFPPLFIFT